MFLVETEQLLDSVWHFNNYTGCDFTQLVYNFKSLNFFPYQAELFFFAFLYYTFFLSFFFSGNLLLDLSEQ